MLLKSSSVQIPPGWKPPDFAFGQRVKWTDAYLVHGSCHHQGTVIGLVYYGEQKGWWYNIEPDPDTDLAVLTDDECVSEPQLQLLSATEALLAEVG